MTGVWKRFISRWSKRGEKLLAKELYVGCVGDDLSRDVGQHGARDRHPLGNNCARQLLEIWQELLCWSGRPQSQKFPFPLMLSPKTMSNHVTFCCVFSKMRVPSFVKSSANTLGRRPW